MRNNLVEKRKEKLYTQKELAALLGISENYYQKLEYGISTGSLNHWYKLKEILGATSIDFLLENTTEDK